MTQTPSQVDLLYAVKGGKTYGLGHVARCRMFFRALGFHESGGERSGFFALLHGDEWAENFLINEKIPYLKVGGEPTVPFGTNHFFSGVKGVKLVVLDFSQVQTSEKELFRQIAGKTVLMDDEGRSDPETEICDWVVNGQYLPGPEADQTLDTKRYLVGPEYFFLTEELLEVKRKTKVYSDQVETGFVGFGGGTQDQFQQLLVTVLAECGIRRVILATGFHPSPNTGWISKVPIPIEFCTNPKSVAQGMADADFSVTSGGLMKFESASVGTPPIIIALNEGQTKVSRRFEEFGLGRFLEQISESHGFSGEKLADLVRHWIANPSLLKRMGEKGRKTISGDGIGRLIQSVKSALLETSLGQSFSKSS